MRLIKKSLHVFFGSFLISCDHGQYLHFFCIFAALPLVSVFCFVFFWRSKFETGKCLGREREGDDTTDVPFVFVTVGIEMSLRVFLFMNVTIFRF